MDFNFLIYLFVGVILGILVSLVYDRYWKTDFHCDMNNINTEISSFHLKLDRIIDKIFKV